MLVRKSQYDPLAIKLEDELTVWRKWYSTQNALSDSKNARLGKTKTYWCIKLPL